MHHNAIYPHPVRPILLAFGLQPLAAEGTGIGRDRAEHCLDNLFNWLYNKQLHMNLTVTILLSGAINMAGTSNV